MAVTHTKVSGKADGPDATLVLPSDWNASHTVGDLGGTPAPVLSTSNVAGNATTYMRTNDQLALFDATVPSTQAFGDAAATGSAAIAARRDHKHAMPALATNTVTLSTTAGGGVATTAARSDAVIAAFDATVPTTQALADAAATGSIAFAARRDHLHGMPTVAQMVTALGGQVGGCPLFGVLASDFLFTVSNTTLQSITGLSFAIGASATEIWLVEVFAEITAANATMDSQFKWATMPTGATMRWGAMNQPTAAGVGGYGAMTAATTPAAMLTEASTLSIGTLAGTNGNWFAGKVYGGGTAGTIQLQGCQNTSDAGQLTARAGSVLRATKVKA